MGWREDNADINEKIYRIRMQGMILRMRMERWELEDMAFRSRMVWELYKIKQRGRERLEMRSPESGKTQPRNNKGQYKKYKTDGSGNGGSAAGSTGVMNMVTPNTVQQNIGGINGNPVLTGSVNGGIIKSKNYAGNTVSSYPRDELEKMIEKSNSCEKAVFAVDTPINKFASNAQKIRPVEGKYDVALHGANTYAEFFGKPINASDLAEIIKHRPDYKPGTPIRLFSCNTGNIENTGDCFAQELATALNTTVEAPQKKIYVREDGTFYDGDPGNTQLKTFWSRRYW